MDIERGAAYGQTQYVDVSFPTANTDVRIRHFLKAVPYTAVYYTVVKKSAAGDVYTGTASLWGPQYIALKSDTAGLEVTLLLFTKES
jgi:hypothetical protein